MFVGFGIDFASNYWEHLCGETKKLHLRKKQDSIQNSRPLMVSRANQSYVLLCKSRPRYRAKPYNKSIVQMRDTRL